MNVYATLDDLKELLNIEGGDHNAQLLRLLTAASREVEKNKLTGRFFYCWEGAKYYSDVNTKIYLPDDILSVSTLKCDTTGDASYDVTMASTDYFLKPFNEYPKVLLEININGDYGHFCSGIEKGLEITGVFGYADSATPYVVKTALDESGNITAAQTNFTVDDGNEIKIGQTIRIDSEQMYIEDLKGNELYVKRGVNGTTAAIHNDGASVYVYTYPEDIIQASLILAMRAWKRKDSAYQDIVGTPETGQVITSKGIDPDVLELCQPYQRKRYL